MEISRPSTIKRLIISSLYDISLSVVDSGQLGEDRKMTRDEAIYDVLSWNKLNNKTLFLFSPQPEACEAFENEGITVEPNS